MAAATQTRILAGVEDDAAVRFRCSSEKCGGETIHRLDRKPENLPLSCPHCGEQYHIPGTPDRDLREHLVLILLAELRRCQDERSVRLILEIDPGA